MLTLTSKGKRVSLVLLDDKFGITCIHENMSTGRYYGSILQFVFYVKSKSLSPMNDNQYLSIVHYRIYLAIRRGFHLSRMTTNILISSM